MRQSCLNKGCQIRCGLVWSTCFLVCLTEHSFAQNPPSLSLRLREELQRVAQSDEVLPWLRVMKTPGGELVLADRVLVYAAQNPPVSASSEPHSWFAWVSQHWQRTASGWQPKPEYTADWLQLEKELSTAADELHAIAAFFAGLAERLPTEHPTYGLIRRFLADERAPALVYLDELRRRLHPQADDLLPAFEEHVVRNLQGRYVIRLTRRPQMERWISFLEQAQPVLQRFQQELQTWHDELRPVSDEQRRLVHVLREADFAAWLFFEVVTLETGARDEPLDQIFDIFEEATIDTPQGLVFAELNDPQRQWLEWLEQYTRLREYKHSLQDALQQFLTQLDTNDELHQRWQRFLSSPAAFMFVARRLNYLPVTAGEAAREWLARWLAETSPHQWEFTLEQTDIQQQVSDWLRELRLWRRRQRVIHDWLPQTDKPWQEVLSVPYATFRAWQLLEQQAQPQPDLVQHWFLAHFSEQEAGWVPHEGTLPILEEMIEEARQVEAAVQPTDF
ncbi:MAG: hypothetical protein KatS3mg114_1186 [Planctomycetaceae bacterium]|nr:MAG: hypothetical protein KatS3mg114_1186 [Planctomycetaceae bacterium]